jgi:hypothetical protein
VKPSQGTRGLGHKIVACEDIEDALHAVAKHSPPFSFDREIPSVARSLESLSLGNLGSFPCYSEDKVAQLLVDAPLLVRGRKFDVRMFVFVRSFLPFEG